MFLLYQRVVEAGFSRIFQCILFLHGSGTVADTVLPQNKQSRCSFVG